MNGSKGKYFVKNTSLGSFQDVTSMFDGVAILKVDGLLAKGKAINIYTAQWIDSQTEDFAITTTDQLDNPIVIRENVTIEITFIVRSKYADNEIDVLSVHDDFVDYMTGGDVWIKSAYVGNKSVHCVCLDEYAPTSYLLNRGEKSYIMGTIKLHTLSAVE